MQDLDRVLLRDQSVQYGRVVDTGGYRIALEYRGAKRHFPKRDIERIEYFKGRKAKERLETDLVILRLNRHHVRCKILRETGDAIRVELPNGARITYARNRVLKVLYRDQILTEASSYYNQDLESAMNRAISAIEGGKVGEENKEEKFLVQAGIFAVEHVRRAVDRLRESKDEIAGRLEAAKAFGRILHVHGLKCVVTREIEEAVPTIYEDLTYAPFTVKESLLKVVYSRFDEASVPLALYLIRYPQEDPRIRAMSVEILRRLGQNRALVTLYNENSGQLQFVAAVALARNRILVGLPTLIDALSLGGEKQREIRELAARVLRETAGKDHGFRADGTPEARATSIEEWRQWWAKNETSINEESRLILTKKQIQTVERREAIDLWKRAHEFLRSEKYRRSEIFLRESVKRDPSFHKAQTSLAVLLYSHLADKVKDETERDKLLREAERLLDTVAASADPEMNDRDRHWIHYELGTVRMIRGDVLGALDEYNSSVALDPTSISGMIGVGACHWMLATTKNELTPSERKIELQAALRTFLGAIQSIENRLRTVQVLGTGDAPKVDELPFPRRVYNQNVLSVREDLESTSIGLFVRVAKIYRLRGDTKSAALALKEGLDTLRASTELRDSSSLEIELRTQLGSVYESVKKYALAAQQYGTVLKNLDPDHEHARRGYDRVKDRDEAPAGGGRDAVTRREER